LISHSTQFRDRDFGTQISSTKQGEINPVWDETFTFNVDTLNNMMLYLRVYDDDIGSGDDKCGKCRVKLEHEDITSDPKRFERTIDFNLLSRNGTLTFEVSYEE
jgi:Ca2+-dependent lipid-binding protein